MTRRARGRSLGAPLLGVVLLGAPLLGVVLLRAALLAVALAGCGQPVGGTPAPGPCGTVQLRGSAAINGAEATQAENCFYQGYQQCQRVSLAVNDMGVDSGTDRTFATQVGTNGGCAISDTVYSYVIPTSYNTTNTYTCSGLAQRDDGLHFSGCGADGDVFVPAASASPTLTPAG